MRKSKGARTKVLERNLLTTENVLPMFNPNKKALENQGLWGVLEVPSGPLMT